MLLPQDERLATMLARTRDDLEIFLSSLAGPAAEGSVLAPTDDDTEIWAAGVTYQISREAREAESEGAAQFYRQIYDAERPELFLKSIGWRAVQPGEPIGVRRDSAWNVPEPELAIVVNAHAEIVGYTICNDVSSRSIEGTNPLYLPQAKMYDRSCALGPSITLQSAIADPYDLALEVSIGRGDTTVYSDDASTSLLHRRLPDLVRWLFAAQSFPHGVVLATGTCLVPPEDVTLMPGDVVTIGIAGIGTLINPVVEVGTDLNA